MQIIKSIEISYLRSIHRLNLKQIGDLTIFSGANDVGKSNFLKALNLFFNNEVDWQSQLDFYRDFALRRLNEVRRDSIKGRQFISIAIQFQCPSNYSGSLPPTFKVTRTWFRDSSIPQETNDLDQQFQRGHLPSTLDIGRRFLPQFLNRIRFEYIPAIRDRAYFAYVVRNLQETLVAQEMQPDDPILKAVKELNFSMGKRAEALKKDFHASTHIEAEVSLPESPEYLFHAFSVSTKWQNADDSRLPLSLRGDGIQARYIPSLLNYIAANSRFFHIWGFEEPENSIEYNLAIDLAEKFKGDYVTTAQIFATSHSPAFTSLRGDNIVSYRVYKKGGTTEMAILHPNPDETEFIKLAEDIGLFQLQGEVHHEYMRLRDEMQKSQDEANRLRSEIAILNCPVVYFEGKTDPIILTTAWKKLYGERPMPFEIRSCDPIPDLSGGSGGTGTLKSLLSTVGENSVYVIGIWDYDVPGKKSFCGLPNYFEEIVLPGYESPNNTCKVLKNWKAAGFLLPIPPDKCTYVNYENFCIEFYFSENALQQHSLGGAGLSFEYPLITKQITTHQGKRIDLGKEENHILEARKITSGKIVFAEQVVPTLDTAEFEPFKILFEKIETVLTCLAKKKAGA